MSPPTSPIIILPNGDALRADTITGVICTSELRDMTHPVCVLSRTATTPAGYFASRELAEAARDSVIEQWQAALASASVPAPTPAAPGYARACAIVDEWCAGEDVDSVALVEGLLAVLGGGS